MLTTMTVLALLAFADPEPTKAPPSRSELAAITQRGRDLAGYDQAAWHASVAIQEKNPKEGSIAGYFARKTDKGWVVAFGRLDQDRQNYLIAYEATQGKRPDEFAVKAFDPPKADTGFFRAAARATETALKDFIAHFKGEQRPYNVAILPAEKGQFWVYLVPAPTRPGVWPLGGDVRYLMSTDGIDLVAKRQMHNAVIEKEMPKEAGSNKLAMGFHTHVLSETPEDSDVFHVLSRKPKVPELIRTEHFVFQVDPDGAIKSLGKVEDVFKKK